MTDFKWMSLFIKTMDILRNQGTKLLQGIFPFFITWSWAIPIARSGAFRPALGCHPRRFSTVTQTLAHVTLVSTSGPNFSGILVVTGKKYNLRSFISMSVAFMETSQPFFNKDYHTPCR